MSIHAVPSDCSMVPPVVERSAPVKDPDVVEPEKAAMEHVLPLCVLGVHHQVKQRGEDPCQELDVGGAADPLLDLVDAPGRPGVNRRVHVAEPHS